MDWLAPMFEPFEPRLLMSGVPTMESLLASAVVVDVLPNQQTSIAGSVAGPDSPVLYKFIAPAAGKVQIDMSALSGGIDPRLELYSQTLQRLAGNDNSARGSLDSRISRLVAEGQTFYVLASGNHGTTGTFSLGLSSVPRDDYGNQAGQAHRLAVAPSGAATIGGTINYNGDSDYLSFVATRTGLATVQIAAVGKGNTLVPAVSVRDAQDQPVTVQAVVQAFGAGPGANGGGPVSFDVVAGQTYLLRADGADGSVGGYTVSLGATLAQEFANASLVVLPTPGSLDVTGFLPARGTFTYKFTARADGYVLLSMAAAGGSTLDSMLQVFSADQRLVASNDNAGARTHDSSLRLAVRQGQTYYVRASAAAGSSGNYDLTFTSVPTDDYPDDAASGKAVTVSPNGSAGGAGTINYPGDHDFLKYTAPLTGRAEIVVARAGNALKTAVSVYAANGTLVTSGQVAADGSVDLQWDAVAGGQYSLDVSGDTQTVGAYSWRVLATVLSGFQTAQNVLVPALGSKGVAGTLVAGGSLIYKFTALADGTVTVDMAAANSSGLDASLAAYDSTQHQLAANDNASAGTTNSRVSFVVRAGQTYYVRAMAVGATRGDFALTFASQPSDDAGNDIAHASALVLGVDGSASGGRSINYLADVDVFKIVATATGTMQVRMAAGSSSTVRPTLTASNAAGASLAANGDGSASAVVSFSVTAGQTYYLTASALNATAGLYTLTISTASVVPTPTPVPPTPPTPPSPTDPTPGISITGTVVTDGTGTRLVITGTTGNDVITLSYSGQATLLKTAYGTQTFTGQYSRIVIYGFAGDDVIRDDYSITCPVTIYGGDGNDTIYDNGPGNSTLYGGAGNNLIVSVGGGTDTINGGGGMDSVWCDSTDALIGVSAAASAAGYVHRITSFYQPYASSAGQSGWVSKEISGQDLQDPAGDSYTHGWANFASHPLFAGTPTYNDIRQGSVGDCYYLATLASLADTDPDTIRQMIVDLGDGTYAVRFYRNNQEVYIRLDADLPTYSGTSLSYAKLTPDNEIWVALTEKAYCYFRYGQNSYESISGGWMSTVYQEVTNTTSTTLWTGGDAGSLASSMATALAAGHPITAGTYASPASPIIGGHAYQVKAVQGTGDSAIVTVYNPWGVDGRGTDDNPSDGLVRLSIAQFQACFSSVVISAA